MPDTACYRETVRARLLSDSPGSLIVPPNAQEVLTKLHSYSNNIGEGETEGGNDGNSLLHEV